MARNKVAVIGVGKYGIQIVHKLIDKNVEVFAFDCNADRIENLKDEVALAVALDSTDSKALQSQKIEEMDAVVVAIGENFEATVLTTLNLLDMNIPRVIVRSSGSDQKRILQSLGVKEILSPESEVAKVVAERLVNPSITAFLELPDNYEIAEIKAPKGIANRSLEEIDLTNKYNLTLITLKRLFESGEGDQKQDEEHIIGVTTSDTVIQPQDTLVVFGTLNNVKKFLEINE